MPGRSSAIRQPALGKRAQLGRGHRQPVEPAGGELLVADPQGELASHPAALAVPLVVAQVRRLVGLVHVETGPDDDAVRAEQVAQRIEVRPCCHLRAKQPEVVPEQQGRVEASSQPVSRGLLDRAGVNAGHAAATACLRGSGRHVKRDNITAVFLQYERRPSGPRTDIQYPSMGVVQRPHVNFAEPGQVVEGVEGDESVVALDNDRVCCPVHEVEQRTSERITGFRLARIVFHAVDSAAARDARPEPAATDCAAPVAVLRLRRPR